MFGNNDNQKHDEPDNGGQQPAGPANDFGTMPPIENTPFSTPTTAPVTQEEPVPGADVTPPPQDPVVSAEPAVAVANEAASDLLAIKQDALQQLTPLVGHLEQSPEEKFRTTMMMIQAADDQSLVRDAYDAAKSITEDKARAQALLDVINEINYFTQHNNQ